VVEHRFAFAEAFVHMAGGAVVPAKSAR
jgi:hypothetical protein